MIKAPNASVNQIKLVQKLRPITLNLLPSFTYRNLARKIRSSNS